VDSYSVFLDQFSHDFISHASNLIELMELYIDKNRYDEACQTCLIIKAIHPNVFQEGVFTRICQRTSNPEAFYKALQIEEALYGNQQNVPQNILQFVNSLKNNLGLSTKKILWVGTAGLGYLRGSGFPDLDITLLGIGGHRNWFFHSSLTTVGLYLAIDKLIAYFGNNYDEHNFGAKLIKNIGAPLVAGFAVGNALHLFADGLGAKDVVGFPLGSLFGGGFFVDRLWLFANGAICLILAGKLVAIAFAKDKEAIQNYCKQIGHKFKTIL
jgi:hypothetical protein